MGVWGVWVYAHECIRAQLRMSYTRKNRAAHARCMRVVQPHTRTLTVHALHSRVLCCAVLCYAMRCCAVLCCVVLCRTHQGEDYDIVPSFLSQQTMKGLYMQVFL